VVLALPVSALATPHPDQGDKRAAKAECKTLRGTTEATTEAFLTRFRNFGACVAKRAVEEAVEEQNAHTNAARTCREDRGTTTESREAFAIMYGTSGDTGRNGYRRNAFGKCVSTIAKAKEHAADVKDQQEATGWKSAAEECDAARDASAETFATTWGTDEDAFGKCVSRTAQENNGEESAPQS
jgi:alpha/beta superfamily hydrolase